MTAHEKILAPVGGVAGARCPGDSVQDVYRRDRGELPKCLAETAAAPLEARPLTTDVYTSRDFHARELERMWSRVWQMAGREEDIPKVGDHFVYEIGATSLIIVRSGAAEIRALYNSCLHRGTALRECGGNVSQFRCPFHAFTWDLHGKIKRIPSEWDFQDIRGRVAKLPEARLDTWGGFIFVNLDEEAESLQSYLESVPKDFERWPLDQRFTASHVAKELDCNWKVAQEAFIEVFHVIGIHPQSLPMFGDANAQYDVWPERRHTSRMINLSAVASPHLRGYSEQRILDASAEFGLCDRGATVPAGKRARDVVVEVMRERFRRDLGVDTSGLCDTEVLDVIQYNVFPNLMLFGGLGSPLVYRVRPQGDDPGRCLFEVWLLLPFPKDAPRPPAAPLRILTAEDRWSSVEELSYFGAILDQDFDMMPQVQRGLRASKSRQVLLSTYQESRIRHMRQTLDEYVRR